MMFPISLPPETIAIDHDDYHAKYIGRTADNRQFFLTTPFVPAIDDHNPGREFIALFLFDLSGKLLEARIDNLGPRAEFDEKRRNLRDQWLAELGLIEYCRIEVCPFEIDRFGETFGLILRPPEEDLENERWRVELHPGNYMAFHEPWDSGEYDT